MNILQVCAYAAEYEGNFMNSLYVLERRLSKKGHVVFYAFPERALKFDWCKKLNLRTKVFFLPEKRARINIQTYKKIKKIIKENNVGIVHSHFELYDIPCNMMSGKNCKVFWHLHDPINNECSFSRRILNKLQYSILSRGAVLLSVSEHYRNIAINLGFKKNDTMTILNGIDLNRIKYPYSQEKKIYNFATFGWDFERKGSDIIFKALEQLYNKGFKFKLLFNCNQQTLPKIKRYFDNNYPEWLEIGMPVEDINEIFSVTDTFIQASRRETFSYAVCEAAYAGLNVVSSDIYGLEWAHSVPTIIFFENENILELSEILESILNKKLHRIESEIDEARNVIMRNFSTEVWADKVLLAYGI